MGIIGWWQMGGSVAAKFETIIFTREERRIIQKAHPQISRINIWWSKELCVPLWAIIKKTQNKTLTE